MTHNQLFGNARWVSPAISTDAALFRSTFTVGSYNNAEITICGLGYFVLYINGKRVGNDLFVPVYSDYHARPDMTLSYPLGDKWSHRTYCMHYNISDYIKEGENVIGVAVGGGFYHQLVRQAEGNVNYGDIKLCYKINIDKAEILSDESIKYQVGFFRSSNIFFGETLDYSGFDHNWNTTNAYSANWEIPRILAAPETDFYIQNCPTDRVVEKLIPKKIKDFGDYSVYSISKNISGYPIVRCNKPGEKIVVECCEEIFDDMNLDNKSIGYGEQRQIETYITDETQKEYHPYFSWFGFRYFSVTNNAVPTEVHVIHSDINVTSNFECSDETINWYYNTFINTQLCNMHGCVPSDCPHRERLGYTGDGQLSCDAVMTMLDAESFYRKWILDIVDCQDSYTGHVQHTAPFAGGGGGPAGWGGAIIVVPYIFYRHYGDKRFLSELFPRMELFVNYMEQRCEGGLIVREEKGGWCLGDWCTPEKISIPEPFVNTTMYISQLEMLAFCADSLGINSNKYRRLAESHRIAVKDKYYNNKTNSFIDGLQGADAFAAGCKIEADNAIKSLVEKYSNLVEFDTGIFGTYFLLNVLFESGNGELACKLLANKKDVSFETMRKAGATTLWENWNGKASHSHPMFGASTQYLFNYILGIKQNSDSVRYDKVTISPINSTILSYAKGYITTSHGKISVEWHKENQHTHIVTEICNDISAVLIFNGQEINLKSGKSSFVF